VWAPDKLARQLRAAREAGCEWAYTGAVSVDGELQVVGGVPPPAPEHVVELLPKYNAVPGGGSNVVARRELLARAGPFDTRLYNTEDWEMWIRLATHGPPAWVCSPLLAYRVHLGNASLKIPEILAGVALIERRHGVKADRGIIHLWLAESCLRTGRRAQALRHFAVAARLGQPGAVARYLSAIARRRLLRHVLSPVLSPPSAAGQSQHLAWTRGAGTWLAELGADAGRGPAGTVSCG
jgi:hypothetical protein